MFSRGVKSRNSGLNCKEDIVHSWRQGKINGEYYNALILIYKS